MKDSLQSIELTNLNILSVFHVTYLRAQAIRLEFNLSKNIGTELCTVWLLIQLID